MTLLKPFTAAAIILCIALQPLPAQQLAKKIKGKWLTIEAGYLRQQQERLEFGFGKRRMVRYYPGNDTAKYHHAAIAWGPQYNLLGFINRNNVLRLGQKVAFAAEYNNVKHNLAWGFKICAAVEYYTKKDVRLSVDGGPLIAGVLHINYGYAIPAGKYRFEDIQRHRVGIIFFINTIGIVEFVERWNNRHGFNGV